MRARSRSLGHAMKRGATALIRSIRHSTVAALRCKRKVLGRHRSRSGGGSGRALGEWFPKPRAVSLPRRGSARAAAEPSEGVFFLQSKNPGHTVNQVLGVKEKFFRRAATPAGVAGGVR